MRTHGKKGYWTDKYSYITGVVRYKDLAYLVLINDEVAKRRLSQSICIEWDAGTWRGGKETLRDWDMVDVAVARKPREQAVFLAAGGQVFCLGSGDRHNEFLPATTAPLRGLRAIDGDLYAVGMNRQVYRRDEKGKWARRPRMGPEKKPVPICVDGCLLRK